jgi:hypothetical protein
VALLLLLIRKSVYLRLYPASGAGQETHQVRQHHLLEASHHGAKVRDMSTRSVSLRISVLFRLFAAR